MLLEGQSIRMIMAYSDAEKIEALDWLCFQLWRRGDETFPVLTSDVDIRVGERPVPQNGMLSGPLPRIPSDPGDEDDAEEPLPSGEHGGFPDADEDREADKLALLMTGGELRQWRDAHGGISQVRLGTLLGIRSQCLSEMENDRRTIPADMRERLARVAEAERA